MAAFDTDELLEDVRLRASLPSGDARFTDAILLGMASRELRERVARLLVRASAEWLVYEGTTAVASGTSAVRLPPRALDGRARDVVWRDSGGTETSLREVAQEDVHRYAGESGTPEAFLVRNHGVVLLPTPNVAGTAVLPYYARPNRLVPPSACAQITAVNAGSHSVTIAALPAGFAVGAALDFLRATPGFEFVGVDCYPTGYTVSGGGYDITFSGTQSTGELASSLASPLAAGGTEMPSGLAVGDWVCLAGTSPVPQVPVECHGLLACLTAIAALRSVGEDASALEADRDTLMSDAVAGVTPRVEGEARIVGHPSDGLLFGLLGY